MHHKIQARLDKVVAPNQALRASLQQSIDMKTKPIGALGVLEETALRLGLIQHTLKPQLSKPTVVVFAADHGLVEEGVSPYPQDVTHQMVYNFLAGGAAISVLSKAHGVDVRVVDVGVKHDFDAQLPMRHAKVAHGTGNMLRGLAMSDAQRDEAILVGFDVVDALVEDGCTWLAFGEMGIGNTSASALLMSLFCDVPVAQCVGRGTGLDDDGLSHKAAVLARVQDKHAALWQGDVDALAALGAIGGLEIAAMVGAMISAAANQVAFVVDGFISTAAYLVAHALAPQVEAYAFFAHQSDEAGHRRMLAQVNARPMLSLDMRLGEGSGAVVAYPLFVSAVTFINDMASFEQAGVSSKAE